MTFFDNRHFIEALIQSGDAITINQEIDWFIEVGAIARRARELSAPAPFFTRIKDYPDYRIFAVPLTTQRRVAIALGLSPDTSPRQLQEEYQRRMGTPVKPLVLSSGACKENIVKGNEVNLYSIPAPVLHEGDGGRYIGSWHLVINKDPDTGWTNWGMYRVMIYNKNTVSILLQPSNDGGRIFYQKYAPVRRPMPVAIAIGVDPLSSLISTIRIEAGLNEADYAGALHQNPVPLVKCETSDLLVPASSEIVLEGIVEPGTRIPEGPFGEFTGYRTSWGWREACHIKAITYRNKPVLTISNPGVAGTGITESPNIAREMAVKEALQKRGILVADVYFPSETVGFLLVVSIKRSKQANMPVRVWNTVRSLGFTPDKIIVTDEDVDAFNMSEVLHAFATRCHPSRNINIQARDTPSALTPYLTPREREYFMGASVLFDCTWPADWSREHDIPPKINFEEEYSKEVKEKIINDWHKYGYK